MNDAAFFYVHRSNLLSYLSLLSGFLALIYTRETGNLHLAGGLIALCGLADIFDGKFANLFERSEKQKAFGVELDSLTDAVVFGVVPAACLYARTSLAVGFTYLFCTGAAFFYLLCAITRLGVYNIYQDSLSHFIGLPTTIAGLLWSSWSLVQASTMTSAILMAGLGMAMVSPLAISRPRKIGLFTLMGWAITLMFLHGRNVLLGG